MSSDCTAVLRATQSVQDAHNLKDSLMGAHTPDVSMKAGDMAVVAMEEFLAWPIDAERSQLYEED